jgi:ATP-dependent DNA helicase DinG
MQADLQRRISRLDTAIKVLRADAPRQEGRHQLEAVMPDMRASFDALRAALEELQQALGAIGDGSVDIDKLREQLLGMSERLALLSSDDSWDGLRWIEVNPRSIRFNLTPLDVSATLSGMIDNGYQAWIFTSATLAVGEDFSHFTTRMGLGGVTALTFPSPYALEWPGLPAARAAATLRPGSYERGPRGRSAAVRTDRRWRLLFVYEPSGAQCGEEVVSLQQVAAWRT